MRHHGYGDAGHGNAMVATSQCSVGGGLCNIESVSFSSLLTSCVVAVKQQQQHEGGE